MTSNNTQTAIKIALAIRSVRPDIKISDALLIARLPRERVNHLRSHGLLNRGEVASTCRKLRFLAA
jgi:hypothetical protein